MIEKIIYLVLILIIILIPHLNNKNKFRLSLLINGKLNTLFIFLFLLFIILENYLIGILLLLLYFVIDIEKNDTIEGFTNYIT
jgi:hypothetical protein